MRRSGESDEELLSAVEGLIQPGLYDAVFAAVRDCCAEPNPILPILRRKGWITLAAMGGVIAGVVLANGVAAYIIKYAIRRAGAEVAYAYGLS